MVDKDFIEELYTLCKKYKKNINVKIEENNDPNISAYEVDICGAWKINKHNNAVVVHAIKYDEYVYSISGDKT